MMVKMILLLFHMYIVIIIKCSRQDSYGTSGRLRSIYRSKYEGYDATQQCSFSPHGVWPQ